VLNALTDYNENGLKCTVNPEVQRLINSFIEYKKPIIFTSTAAFLAAKMFPNVKITVGSSDGLDDECKALGANVIQVSKGSLTVVDEQYKIITTPGHSNSLTPPHLIFEGLLNAIEDAQDLIKEAQEGSDKGKKNDDNSVVNNEFQLHFDKGTYEQYLKYFAIEKSSKEQNKRKR